MSDEPHITYFNMGQWPLFVGFTTSKKAFTKEIKRLAVPRPVPFMGSGLASATTHYFVKDGTTTCIITMAKFGKKKPVEQIAGLIAHEAVHVAQELWCAIGEKEPGREAEAYLVQMITQCCLQEALDTGRCQKGAP